MILSSLKNKNILSNLFDNEHVILVRRFLPMCKPWRKYGLLAGLITGVAAVLQLPVPLLARYVIDKILVQKDPRLLTWVIIIMGTLFVLRILTSLLGSVCLAIFRERVIVEVQKTMFDHVQKLNLSFFDNSKVGEILSRIMNDGRNLQGLMADAILNIVRNFLTLIGVTVMMLLVDWRLGMICLGSLPFFLHLTRVQSSRIRYWSRRFQEEISHVVDTLAESISGIRIVKAFCAEERESTRLLAALLRTLNANLSYTKAILRYNTASAIIAGIGPLIVLWYGGHRVISGNLTIGTLVAFNLLLGYLYGAAQGLISNNADLHSSLASLKRIFDLLDEREETTCANQRSTCVTIRGYIRFEDVSFSYDGGPPVLDSVSFTIEPGEVVAFVGRSGSGKTTLVNLILRFYEPQAGRVLIDGVDIRDIDPKILRSQVAIVPQDGFLFDGDIAENIRYGKPDATFDEIRNAAIAANVDQFVQRLPEGYATRVGERGVKLSGGERKRIAIARAILKDPKILILDEATSEIDSENEFLIKQALRRLMKGRTTLIIAHRFSTIVDADKVIALEGGKIVAIGKHEDLLDTSRAYYLLCGRQLPKGGETNEVSENS